MNQHKRITITVSDEVYSRLKSHADRNDWTVPVLVRRTTEAALSCDCLPSVSKLSDEVFAGDPADTEVLATAEELLIARGQTGQTL